MLVLSRKYGEGLMIGDAHVTIESLRGNRVKLGIDAPQDVKVLRDELDDRNAPDKTSGDKEPVRPVALSPVDVSMIRRRAATRKES